MIPSDEKVSLLGQYKGYSQPTYDGWVRNSQYISMRDGTKLAADIFRPTRSGKPAGEPLPAIWSHHRYHRASFTRDGRLRTMLDQPLMQRIIRHGYIIAIVDVRGSGASFGTRDGEMTRQEAQDAYDVTEWLAQQPWCSGNIGMFGLSYSGEDQYMAASTAPPHLKAIMPEMAMFDLYYFLYPNGVLHEEFISSWSRGNNLLDKVVPAVPVEEDPDGAMVAEARKQHQANIDIYELVSKNVYRDSHSGTTEWSPSNYVEEISHSGVAVYDVGGWLDIYPAEPYAWFNNLRNPKKILMTPWAHSSGWGDRPGWRQTLRRVSDFEIGFDEILDFHAAEMLRWFDHWLKGVNNSIMEEPPIHYFTIGAPRHSAWRSASHWPLPNEVRTRYYFHAGSANSVHSINDGQLSTEPPLEASGQDSYTVDYTTTTGRTTRWTDGHGVPMSYSDMTTNDEKALTYTTHPMTEDIEVTGHPIAHLWVSCTTHDADLFVYLEDIDRDGYSTYITEGAIKASHRALATPPFKNMGLPYHSGLKRDVKPLPINKTVELVFDLYPTSILFKASHRIRITLTGADKDNYQTNQQDPAPTINVKRNKRHQSHIILPIIPRRAM